MKLSFKFYRHSSIDTSLLLLLKTLPIPGRNRLNLLDLATRGISGTLMGSIWSKLRGNHSSNKFRPTSDEQSSGPSEQRARSRGRTRTRTPPPSIKKSSSREPMPIVVRNIPASNTSVGNPNAHANNSKITSSTPHDFVWKNGGGKVCLTGSFDNWSQSILMARDQNGVFRATVNLNPKQKWVFKFVVDNVWRCSLDFASEIDENGNVNNVIYPE